MIKLAGINKIYRTNEIETLARENVNLDVAKGEFGSIMGPSGCGKSTLLNIMGLLDAPSSGKIELNENWTFVLSVVQIISWLGYTNLSELEKRYKIVISAFTIVAVCIIGLFYFLN